MKIIIDDDILVKNAKNIQVQVDKIINVDFKKMNKSLETMFEAWEGSGKEEAQKEMNNYMKELETWMNIVKLYPSYIQEYVNGNSYIDREYASLTHKTK